MKLCLWPNSSDVDPSAPRRPWHYGKWGQRGKISQEPVRPKHCRYCGDPIPKGSKRRSYCGAECADAMLVRIVWGVMRARIIARDELCKLCGGASYKPNDNDVWMWGRSGEREPPLRVLEHLTRWNDDGPAIRIAPEWHVDHIVPCADGGTDDPANLRLLCGRCHKRVTREWRARRALAARSALCSAGPTNPEHPWPERNPTLQHRRRRRAAPARPPPRSRTSPAAASSST